MPDPPCAQSIGALCDGWDESQRAEGPRYPSMGQRPRSQPRLTIGGLKARAKCLIPRCPIDQEPTRKPLNPLAFHPRYFSSLTFIPKIACQAPKPPKHHKRNKIELAF